MSISTGLFRKENLPLYGPIHGSGYRSLYVNNPTRSISGVHRFATGGYRVTPPSQLRVMVLPTQPNLSPSSACEEGLVPKTVHRYQTQCISVDLRTFAQDGGELSAGLVQHHVEGPTSSSNTEGVAATLSSAASMTNDTKATIAFAASLIKQVSVYSQHSCTHTYA
jgi:hypothetical protein